MQPAFTPIQKNLNLTFGTEIASFLMELLTITMAKRPDLDFALDLLLARAALDEELHKQIIHDPEACCHRNGIELPAGVRLVITHPGQEVLVREIPMTTSEAGLSKAVQSTRELASAHFNSAVAVENITETELVVINASASDQIQTQTVTNVQEQIVVTVS